jgi:hypothetical protein
MFTCVAPPDTKACRAHHLILYVLRPATFALVALMVACSAAPATETPAASRSEPASAAAVTASPAPATTCPAVRPVSLGAISGRLAYPSEFIPKLVVFAIRADDPTTFHVRHTPGTPPAPPSYSIAAVEPGTYVVISYATSPNPLAGAYTAAVACGMGGQCTDHSLRPVTVAPGQTAAGIDLLDWYAPAGTFPARPASSEELRAGDSVRLCNPYADSANVRASAGLTFPVRRTLDNGTPVTVRDGPLSADGYDWYEVNVAGDQLASGWIVAHALRR